MTDKNSTDGESPIPDIAPGTKKNSVAIDIDKVSPNPDYIDQTFYYKTKGCDVLILHPSLCCPQLMGADEPLKIYILTQKDFYDTWEQTHELPGREGGQAQLLVNLQLFFSPWEALSTPLASKLEPSFDPAPFFSDAASAIENINVHYIDELTDQQTAIHNHQEQIIARIDDHAAKFYNINGFLHLFEIEITNSDICTSLSRGSHLYDLCWLNRSEQHGFHQRQDILHAYYHEHRNKLPGKAYTVNETTKELEFTEDDDTPLQARHPVYISDKPQLSMGHLTDVHVSSRQHMFNDSKAQVIPGDQDGSDNLSSEFIGQRVHRASDGLINLMSQFGENNKIDLLIFTGDLVDYGRNFNPESSKGKAVANSGKRWGAMNLDQVEDPDIYPTGIDLLSMYSLFNWYLNTYKKPLILIAGNHEGYTVPYGISPRAMKLTDSLLSGVDTKTGYMWEDKFSGHFTHTGSNQPVNTQELEGYYQHTDKLAKDALAVEAKRNEERTKSYREQDYMLMGTRANEGIPADHNLTIYEACLMYGPDYYRVRLPGFKNNQAHRNFQSYNLDNFYLFFTPLVDFWIQYRDQAWVGLGWGNDESFIGARQGLIRNTRSHKLLFQKALATGEDKPKPKPKQIDASLWQRVKDRSVRAVDYLGDVGKSTMIAGGSPGILPQSVEAISDHQLELMQTALQQEAAHATLLTHFTLVNYHPSMSMQDLGVVDSGGVVDNLACFDWGSFLNNRTALYREGIMGNQFNLTLSGHSHRAALYQQHSEDIDLVTQALNLPLKLAQSMGIDTQTIKGDMEVIARPRKHKAGSKKLYQDIDPNQCQILVSACGGPIAVQNYQDELLGLGLDYPSGSWHDPSTSETGTVTGHSVKTRFGKTIDTSKPRFAVAIDFVDLLGPDKHVDTHGVFAYFKNVQEEPATFEFELNRVLPKDLIGSIEIKVWIDKLQRFICFPFKHVMAHPSSGSMQVYRVRMDYRDASKDADWGIDKNTGGHKQVLNDFIEMFPHYFTNTHAFLSVTFNKGSFAKEEGYKQYDYDSPWVFPIQEFKENVEVIVDETKKKYMLMVDEYQIKRRVKSPEIPDFQWYSKTWPEEYEFDFEDADNGFD